MNKVSKSQDEFLHHKLPIDKDEVIIGVYRHHPIAYIIPIVLALFMIVIIAGLAYLLLNVSAFGGGPIISGTYQGYTMAGVALFCTLILLAAFVPVWVKSQDQLVLTDEALLQLLQTSIFSDKVSQLSLQHVSDVTVKANFWGNMLGYGHLTIETPGEQDNYEYSFLPDANAVAREISEAHENFISLLESGRMHLDSQPATLNATRIETAPDGGTGSGTIVVDPAEYQKFLEYQQQQGSKDTTSSSPQ